MYFFTELQLLYFLCSVQVCQEVSLLYYKQCLPLIIQDNVSECEGIYVSVCMY